MKRDPLIPYEEISQSVWKRLTVAADDPTNPLRLMAVATVDAQGRPCNRTLVLRGIDRPSGLAWFHTDRRSPKMQHLKQRPIISALGYDPKDQVQIRLDGAATLHENDALAEQHWQQVSLAARFVYSLPQAPGEPLQPDPRIANIHKQQKAGESGQGRGNFVVIQLQIEVIDWLQIGADEQHRAILRAKNGWEAEPLSP